MDRCAQRDSHGEPEPERTRDLARLVELRMVPAAVAHFLEQDQVGFERRERSRGPHRVEATVGADAAVNVPAHHPKPHGHAASRASASSALAPYRLWKKR